MPKNKPLPIAWYARAPRLSTICKWINLHTSLHAQILEGFCDTDRVVNRIRYPGKGRVGNLLLVVDDGAACVKLAWNRKLVRTHGHVVIEHNAAETYRTNSEVVEALDRYLGAHPEAMKGESNAR
jgi:hypothetical protein